MLTIVTWRWSGWRNIYTAEHVNKLGRMLAKHTSIPYRFVCITDDSKGIECETFPLWLSEPAKLPTNGLVDVKKPIPNCFTRLRAFDPTVGQWFGDKILSIDLDTVVLGDLAPLITDDSFKAAMGYHSPICGTMWQLKIGEHSDVWFDYDPVETPKLIAETMYDGKPISGSDQAWMSIKMPDAPTWNNADGVYWFKAMKPQRLVPQNARVVYFAGSIKPWSRDCQMICPALYNEYARA